MGVNTLSVIIILCVSHCQPASTCIWWKLLIECDDWQRFFLKTTALMLMHEREVIIKFKVHRSNINFEDCWSRYYTCTVSCWWADQYHSHWKSFYAVMWCTQVPRQTFSTMRSRYHMTSRPRTQRWDDYSWSEVGGYWCVSVCVCTCVPLFSGVSRQLFNWVQVIESNCIGAWMHKASGSVL